MFLLAWKSIGKLVRNSTFENSGEKRHVKMFGIAESVMFRFPVSRFPVRVSYVCPCQRFTRRVTMAADMTHG